MTPTEAERLRDLFFEARQTARYTDLVPTRDSFAADDAAVEAFNTALKEATVQPTQTHFIERAGVYTFDATGKPVLVEEATK